MKPSLDAWSERTSSSDLKPRDDFILHSAALEQAGAFIVLHERTLLRGMDDPVEYGSRKGNLVNTRLVFALILVPNRLHSC